jgi:predicted transcriptional regulator
MATTIQISEELQSKLAKRKMYERETYEEIIWDLLEDTMEISEETRKEIGEAREDVKKGRVYTLEQVKKEAGL